MGKINNIRQLLNYGWNDKNIASYLNIKKSIVRYYRRKLNITNSKYRYLH